MNVAAVAPAPPLASAPAPSAAAPAPGAPAPQPPLQSRTPAQLRDGLHIEVKGARAGADDALALARLMQDAADWTANVEHTTPSLGSVKLHDRWGDISARAPLSWLEHVPVLGRAFGGYQAVSTYRGKTGHFALADSQSKVAEAGIARLRTAPIDQWSERDRSDFVEVNATLLHELSHLTLKDYSAKTMAQWYTSGPGIEEGLAELVSVNAMPEFMAAEYGAKLPALTQQLQETASVYTTYTTRMKRLFDLAGVSGREQVLAAARELAGGTRPADRPNRLAAMIAAKVAPGGAAPKDAVDALAHLIPGYVEDGASIRLMDAVAALADAKAPAPASASPPAPASAPAPSPAA